ncbi:M56 family metallopeptidase [Neptunicella marina]|uniref:Protein TonB n=1 Tax=Neptunicella marina TaxID=2125989 RepID=A0A8J6ITI0_9ALTE|nr:M56 family metallopeptidase [Neptunicella marina]MBC3766034.1 M56 family metallopeptidase [Neptunicella marina]
MANWVMSQQLALTLVLLVLVIIERFTRDTLAPQQLYRLWLMVPLILLVNNLPADIVQVNQSYIPQYVVSMAANKEFNSLSIGWHSVWLVGASLIVIVGVFAQRGLNKATSEYRSIKHLPIALPKCIAVRMCNSVGGPLLSGIFKPVLYLPQDFFNQYNTQQQIMMIQHELVHFKRKDNWFNLLALALLALFWFNPLTWLAYRSFKRNQETACDAVVLENASQQEKVLYSKTLVQCAEHSLHALPVYSSYGEKTTMFKRIHLIQQNTEKRPLFTAGVLGLFAAIFASVALAGSDFGGQKVLGLKAAMPVKRIEPLYPPEAIEQKLNGSVVLRFDIEADGSTSNIEIVKSQPENTFDKNSVAALKQWIYKPRIVGGVAQKQSGLLVQLDYLLGPDQPARPAMIETIKVSQTASH